MNDTAGGFRAPSSITPEDLGDDLARLVWESFSDFFSEDDTSSPFRGLGLVDDEGQPKQTVIEEALIFIMWAHTRGAQQAFVGRAEDTLLKRSLDELHKLVFEDMVENGTPRSQVPFFEQRVSARYSEYHGASAGSDGSLSEAVARHLVEGASPSDGLKYLVAERALQIAGPLKDYLEDVELVD